MKEILLNAYRKLNEDEILYRNRFIELLSRMALILQAGEKFCQCLDTDGEYLYYNPQWFVSNYGYVISVARNTFYELKPSLKVGGFERHGETRWTDYLQKTYNQWRRDQARGWEPQYYFYGNSYPYSHGMTKIKELHPVAQKLVAYYFLPEEDRKKVLDSDWSIHHKKSFDWNKSSKYNNRADNLQVLWQDPETTVKECPERNQHTFIHNVDRSTSPTNIENLMKRSQEPNVPHYIFMQPGSLEKFILSGLKADPNTAVGVSVKNEDGSTFMNAYYDGSDAKLIDD